jgi:hypothetical protein
MCKMLILTIQAVVEPKPNTDVVLWRMKPTSFFVRRFSAPGGFGHGEVWEEELGKLKKVLVVAFCLLKSIYIS